MKCHYEVLGVSKDVNNEDLKKAYRVLALKWHPDKNLDNAIEAKEQFQLVQQAYEILSDSHERAFYDKHRDSILCSRASYEDNSLDVFPYFTSTCFMGYGDDEKGFYAIYREVFNKIAAEDSKLMQSDNHEIPSFGRSDSSYEDVVHPFYAYWLSYSTKKSYAWLDPIDVRGAPNRRILKYIEKENKKVRDKAKKERNEEVRNLAAFVRKRDKRVLIYRKILEERASANEKKTEEKRKQVLREKQASLKEYKESEWSKFSNLEQELAEIEIRMVAEFGEKSTSPDVGNNSEVDYMFQNLFCVACDKIFKTDKSFANHEKSKKHKEKVELLKVEVINNELKQSKYSLGIDDGSFDNNVGEIEDSDVEKEQEVMETKTRKKKKRKSRFVDGSVHSDASDSNVDLTFAQSKKQRKKLLKQSLTHLQASNFRGEVYSSHSDMSDIEDADDESVSQFPLKSKIVNETKLRQGGTCNGDDAKNSRMKMESIKTHCRSESNGRVENEIVKQEGKGKCGKESHKSKKDSEALQLGSKEANVTCVTCHAEFLSKNKLFEHLKKSAHSVCISRSLEGRYGNTRTRKLK